MEGFAVLSRAKQCEIEERYPLASRIYGMNRILQPFKEQEVNFKGVLGAKISVPPGFEAGKVNRAYRASMRRYGYVLSEDYDINYNPYFHHSCLIRALDFFTVSQGCDLRLSEVVIADAASFEGRNAFRLLVPFARRIILVSDKKSELLEEADYAMNRYGSSVAVVEDPVRAAERADALVISSDSDNHRYLLNIKRPMLYFKYITPPSNDLWFNKVDISYKGSGIINTIFAQGYLNVYNKKPLWRNAETEGFVIRNIRKNSIKLMER